METKDLEVEAIVKTKPCTRCKRVLELEKFRTRPSGFTLNQCRECESAMGKARREAAKGNVVPAVSQTVTVTTKSGLTIEASLIPINGGRKASSPNTDKVLYFTSEVSRDAARLALSNYANIVRTGITYQTV